MNTLSQIVILTRYGLRFYWRRRDALLLCATVILFTCLSSALHLFANSVQHMLNRDVAQFLGADVLVEADRPLTAGMQEYLASQQVNMLELLQYRSAIAPQGNYQAVVIKVVPQGYPLRGQMLIQTANGPQSASGIPEAGQVWIAPQLMHDWGLTEGVTLTVGRAEFSVGHIIELEPDRLTQLQHTMPTLMMGREDFKRAGFSMHQPGLKYRYLINALPGQKRELTSRLRQLPEGYRVMTADAGQHPFSRMVTRTQRFLGLASILIFMVSGWAVYVLGWRCVISQTRWLSVVRGFGLSRRTALTAHITALLLMAFAAVLIGIVLGSFLQIYLIRGVEHYFQSPAAAWHWRATILPIAIGALLVIALIVPLAVTVHRVSLVVLLQGARRIPRKPLPVILAATLCIAAMLLVYSDNSRLTMILAVILVAMMSFAMLLAYAQLGVMALLKRVTGGVFKVAMCLTERRKLQHLPQLAMTACAIMAILVSMMVRDAFVNTYSAQRLAHDGNFIIDHLPPTSRHEFTHVVEVLGGQVKHLHPVVDAYLTAINAKPVDQAVAGESDSREEARSKIRLSWSRELPANNALMEGRWWSEAQWQEAIVSVDDEAMQDLGLTLGDTLTFSIGERQLQATIQSSRRFVGGGSSYMFWMMFPPETLSTYPYYYTGGLELPKGNALAQLLTNFPQVKLTSLEHFVNHIRRVFAGITRLMDIVLSFVLLAQAMALCAAVFSFAAERQLLLNIFRSAGARRLSLLGLNAIEFAFIGLMASLVGLLGANGAAHWLFQQQFNLPYQADWMRWAQISLLTSGAFMMLGLLLTYRGSRGDPTQLLKQE